MVTFDDTIGATCEYGLSSVDLAQGQGCGAGSNCSCSSSSSCY